MNNILYKNIIRIILLCLIQVFVLKEVIFFGDRIQYVEIFIYPIGIMLLPLALPRFFFFIIAFFIGISVDLFYDTLGVNTSAAVWMAFSRSIILKYLEPKSGYTLNQSPVAQELGIFWFMQYMAFNLAVFVLAFYSMKVFTFVFIFEILIRSTLSFVISYFILFLVQIIFDPKN